MSEVTRLNNFDAYNGAAGLTSALYMADFYRQEHESHIDAYLRGPFSPRNKANPQRSMIEQYVAHQAAISGTPQFRAHAPLPIHAEEMVDREILEVGLERLTVVQEFMARGLTTPIPNWLAIMSYLFPSGSKFGEVRRQMNPEGRGSTGLQDITYSGLPLYATVGNFSLGLRFLLEAQRAGMPLDVSYAGQLVRRMNESFEDAAIKGVTDDGVNLLSFDGKTVPGLLNAPSAQNYQYLAGAGTGTPRPWDNPAKTGFEIIDGDVLAMVKLLQSKNQFGPYTLFLNTSYGLQLNRPYNSPYASDTILGRLGKLQTGSFTGIKVVVADRLPADRIALVQMTPSTGKMLIGQQPTSVSWASDSGFSTEWLIVGCIVPQFRADYDGQSGICLGDIVTH